MEFGVSFSVESEYRTSLANAKNNNETALKWRVSQHGAELSALRERHSGELERVRAEHEGRVRLREKEHAAVVEDLQQKDAEWRQEKQVNINLLLC